MTTMPPPPRRTSSLAQQMIRERKRRDRIAKIIANWIVAASAAVIVSIAGAPTWAWLATGLIIAWSGKR